MCITWKALLALTLSWPFSRLHTGANALKISPPSSPRALRFRHCRPLRMWVSQRKTRTAPALCRLLHGDSRQLFCYSSLEELHAASFPERNPKEK